MTEKGKLREYVHIGLAKTLDTCYLFKCERLNVKLVTKASEILSPRGKEKSQSECLLGTAVIETQPES